MTGELAVLYQSNLPSLEQRAIEEKLVQPLTSGGGVFGTSKIDLMKKKKEVLKELLDVKDDLPQNQDLIDKLEEDGMYIDSSTM